MLQALIPLALQFVPGLVGAAFGKNAESVAASVGEAAQAVFGTDDKDKIEKAIAADPKLAWAFKEKLLDLRDREGQREHDERMAELKGVENAREMFKSGGQGVASNLAYVTVAAFFVINGAMLWGYYALLTQGVQIKNPELVIAIANAVGLLAGFINSKAEQVYGFFFGSSVSARANAQAAGAALGDIAKKATGAGR
ncbi:MAG: hypothetical protein ING19_05320 [Azospirillum sp.]|nr:hypothetical protein [Azospirillum sp.]MCA3265472.1 hypothetical protein [Azospirillum sp.]